MVAGGCVVAGGAEAGVVGAGVMTSVVTAGCVFVVVGGGGNGCCSGGAGPPVAGACTGGAGSVVGPSDAGAGDGGGAAVVVTPGLCGVPGAVGWSPVDNPIATAAPTSNTGKAVRGPAKDTLLSHAASVTGRGRGFAVHEALDQVGAMIGPLTVAGMLAITGNAYAPALGVLTLPGGAALALLLWLQRRVPRPESYEDCPVVLGNPSAPRPWALPAQFWLYCGFTAITMLGFGTFGLLSFHMVSHGVLAAAMVPVVYAAAMAADALTALASGFSYDRYGAKTLAVLPILSILVVLFAFTDNVTMVVIGTLVWGAAVGIQESTLRGVVADLVASPRRASAYGVFAAGLGAATAGGGALIGWLYDISIGTLVVVVIALELMALVMMFAIRLPRVAPS
ncbi:integral membrane protein [Mycobacterium tuberculosis]|nr:integral membrane protein [Mycobacterium tuberculosis]